MLAQLRFCWVTSLNKTKGFVWLTNRRIVSGLSGFVSQSPVLNNLFFIK